MGVQLGVGDHGALSGDRRRLVGQPLARPSWRIPTVAGRVGVIARPMAPAAGQLPFQLAPRNDRIIEAHTPVSNMCSNLATSLRWIFMIICN